MKLLPVLTSASLLVAGAAFAQQYPGSYANPLYADRGPAYYAYDRNPGDLFGRVRSDVDRAENNSHWNGGDRKRFNKVREELSEFERSGSRHELNDTISALQHVLDNNRLAYPDREVLARDLYALRDFKARYGWR